MAAKKAWGDAIAPDSGQAAMGLQSELTIPQKVVIDNALALLKEPSNFCKGRPAVDIHGRRVSPTDREAVRWDILGALRRAATMPPGATENDLKAVEAVLYEKIRANEAYAKWDLLGLNDHRGYYFVVSLLQAVRDGSAWQVPDTAQDRRNARKKAAAK
jgi:hypothetical protein